MSSPVTRRESGPSACVVSPIMLITPSEPRSSLISKSTNAPGKSVGSSTFPLSTSLILWRIVKILSWGGGRWLVFPLQNICVYHIYVYPYLGRSFFFFCLGSSSYLQKSSDAVSLLLLLLLLVVVVYYLVQPKVALEDEGIRTEAKDGKNDLLRLSWDIPWGAQPTNPLWKGDSFLLSPYRDKAINSTIINDLFMNWLVNSTLVVRLC